MNRSIFFLFSVFCPLFSVLCSLVLAEGVALKEIPPMPEGTVLFEREAAFAQRGRVGGYAMKPSTYGIHLDTKVHLDGSESGIAIRYHKAPDPSFCGAYVIVVGDLSNYATLSFWVKGAKGGEAFEVGLNDVISNKREDAVFVGSIYRYLPWGVKPEWQQVKVPLEDFFGADLKTAYSLVFNFNEEGNGTFWVDGITLHPEVLSSREETLVAEGKFVLDNFDHSSLNLLGRKANAYKRLPSICKFSRVLEPKVGAEGRSLRLDYDKRNTGWCGYYTLLNQIDGAYYDLSPYQAVSFWVRGLEGGETFEIGMADRSWLTIGDSVKAGPIEKYLPQGVTPSWQQVVIPLSDFGKLGLKEMGSFVINFHRPGQGAIFIDELVFVRKTQQDLLKEWEGE